MTRKVQRRYCRNLMGDHGVRMTEKANGIGALIRNKLASPKWQRDAQDAKGTVRNLSESWSCEMTGRNTSLNSVPFP